jgi:excisionase family DNA binding protein
MKVQRCD